MPPAGSASSSPRRGRSVSRRPASASAAGSTGRPGRPRMRWSWRFQSKAGTGPPRWWCGRARTATSAAKSSPRLTATTAPNVPGVRRWRCCRWTSTGPGFAAVGAADPVIGGLQERYPGLRPVLFHSPYEAAASFLIGHRISIAQSRAIRRRIAEERGAAIPTTAGVGHAFPAPSALLACDAVPGVPALKLERVHAAARAAIDGMLDRDRLRAMPDTDALAELGRLPGVGPFFAQGILMRGAGLVDAVTDDDVTKQAIQRAYRLHGVPTGVEMAEISERWRPFRMWATVLLHVWLRTEEGGEVRARRR